MPTLDKERPPTGQPLSRESDHRVRGTTTRERGEPVPVAERRP
jgi:hypothetical protein